MNIQRGFLLLGAVTVILFFFWGFGWLYVNVLDKWIFTHQRLAAILALIALAVVTFIIGAV